MLCVAPISSYLSEDKGMISQDLMATLGIMAGRRLQRLLVHPVGRRRSSNSRRMAGRPCRHARMQASLEGPEGISTIRSRLQRNVEGRRLRFAPFLLALRHQARWSAFPSHPANEDIDLSGFASSDVTRCRSEERP